MFLHFRTFNFYYFLQNAYIWHFLRRQGHPPLRTYPYFFFLLCGRTQLPNKEQIGFLLDLGIFLCIYVKALKRRQSNEGRNIFLRGHAVQKALTRWVWVTQNFILQKSWSRSRGGLTTKKKCASSLRLECLIANYTY